MITINAEKLAKTLAAVTPFMSTDYARANLCGVLLERAEGGSTDINVVATDGCTLANVQLAADAGAALSLLLSSDCVKMLVKVLGKRPIGGVVIDAEAKTLTHGGSTYQLATIDARYPDWTNVVPPSGRDGKMSCIGINGNYVVRTQKLFDILGGNKSAGIKMEFGFHEADPILCTQANTPARVVIMGMRV